MKSKFFSNKNEGNNLKQNNLKQFLENFPEHEFWRFFIERERYSYSSVLYQAIYASLNDIPTEHSANIPINFIEYKLKKLTVSDVYHEAEKRGNSTILTIFNDHLKLQDRKNETLNTVINNQQGWVGFEEIEPGYLIHATKGFQFILLSVIDREPLTIEFIKKLHTICTEGVEKMIKQTPGEFREYAAEWQISTADTLPGLIETINYLKSVEKDMGQELFLIQVITKENEVIEAFDFQNEEDTDLLVKEIWEHYEAQSNIDFIATQVENDCLLTICNQQIKELEASLSHATTKEEKIVAIFTYLKHAVIFHPFQDGTGRTFSMLLLQFLLMRENFLPILIKDSNIIPGYSVGELVDEYLRAKKEMEDILKNPEIISSKVIADPNINTLNLLQQLPDDKQLIFSNALDVYKAAKKACLAPIEIKTVSQKT